MPFHATHHVRHTLVLGRFGRIQSDNQTAAPNGVKPSAYDQLDKSGILFPFSGNESKQHWPGLGTFLQPFRANSNRFKNNGLQEALAEAVSAISYAKTLICISSKA